MKTTTDSKPDLVFDFSPDSALNFADQFIAQVLTRVRDRETGQLIEGDDADMFAEGFRNGIAFLDGMNKGFASAKELAGAFAFMMAIRAAVEEWGLDRAYVIEIRNGKMPATPVTSMTPQ